MIEAMKQWLEELEGIHPGNMTPMAEESWKKVILSLRQAIEQAEKQVCVACEGNPQGENIPCAVCGATPQPQREWVSLTLDEIWEVYKKHGSLEYKAFARAIEQALKEKNT